MSSDLLSSKISIEEKPASYQAIQGQTTSVGMSVGITEKGPIGVATLCTSYAQWRRIFGGEVAGGVAAACVAGFFQNGGRTLYFTRTVHYANVANAASKTSAKATLKLKTAAVAASAAAVRGTNLAPYALTPGDTLEIDVDGNGSATATINAVEAQRITGTAAPYNLDDGQDLIVKIDGGEPQTIEFLASEFADINAATTPEIVAVINAKLNGGFCAPQGGTPCIFSDTKGTDSHVEVAGGSANGALGYPTGVVDGSGNVADISQVSIEELKALIEAAAGCAVTNEGGAIQIASSTTGDGSSVQVLATSTCDDELGFDAAVHSGSTGETVDTLQIDAKYDGTYANDITLLITPATSGDASEFNLAVLDDGVIAERFVNLSVSATAERSAQSVINASSEYITALDLGATASAITSRPANSPGSTPVPIGPLTGGLDGLNDAGSLADADFIGDESAKTGIRSFDQKEGNLLFIPDRPTPGVHNAMLTYCEVTKRRAMFAIIDPPAGLTAPGMVAYCESTAAILNLSEFGATVWPQIRVVNPNASVYGPDDSILVPPGGHIAGLYARVDGARVGGVYDPPGGISNGRLFGAVGLESEEVLEEAIRDILYPKRINPITRLRGQPICVDGVRTLRSSANFPTIAERRGVIFIEQSLKDGLQFARLRNNDASLRAEVHRSIKGFLLAQMKVGAFRSQDPETAFWIDVSEALNPPSEVFAGKLNVRIGLATQKPAEFLVLSFTQDTRALDEELAAAAG